MDDDELLEAMREGIAKQRGYASFFEWHDQQVEERGVVQDFFDAACNERGAPWTALQSVENDPPDCQALDATRRLIGFEVTELVSKTGIIRAKAGHYDPASWDRDGLIQAIQARITKKQPPPDRAAAFDEYIVLVYTAEPWLTAATVRSLLGNHAFAMPEGVSRAYLLMSYEPNLGCTIHRLSAPEA